MWQTLVQVLSALGGLGAIGLVMRQIFLVGAERKGKLGEIESNRQAAVVKFLSEMHPEVARLQARLQAQDAFITELEERARAEQRKRFELQLEFDALKARADALDSQLAAALVELNNVRKGNSE